MAHLLGVQKVAKSGGARLILDDITLGIEDGNLVGVLGPNGAGKSTLLRLLAGQIVPDGGQVTRAAGVRVAYLGQQDDLDEAATILETVHPGRQEHEWASQSQVRALHKGLLGDLDLQAVVGQLSGGQRRRVALAAALTQEAEILILDEPTNHLDVEGVAYLASHLQERFGATGGKTGSGALVVVTHDRWFLDAICSKVWEVIPGHDYLDGRPQVGGRVETYDGGYGAYILARAERNRISALAAEKRQNLLRKELAWLRRGAPARTSKPRFRIAAAEELIADVPPPRDQVELLKMATARLGKDVIDLENVSLCYGDKTVLQGVTWRLAPGERVGIIGANGAGKTTLLRLLAGALQPTAGRVKQGKTVQLAMLSQSTRELDEVSDLRVVEAVAKVALSLQVGGKDMTAAQLVERLGFTRERAWTPVKEISGGERRRLQFMRLLMTEPNVLLLDEPTNDLDTDTLAAIEDLLDSWPGTLIVVSHDRYLLERITDRQFAVFADGRVQDLPGGVDEYLALRAAAQDILPARPLVADGVQAASPSADGPSTEASSAAQLSAGEMRAMQKEVARVERRLGKVQAEIAQLHEALAQAATEQQVDQLTELSVKLDQLNKVEADLEAQWLQAAEALE